jgi:hypothetical protein
MAKRKLSSILIATCTSQYVTSINYRYQVTSINYPYVQLATACLFLCQHTYFCCVLFCVIKRFAHDTFSCIVCNPFRFLDNHFVSLLLSKLQAQAGRRRQMMTKLSSSDGENESSSSFTPLIFIQFARCACSLSTCPQQHKTRTQDSSLEFETRKGNVVIIWAYRNTCRMS